MHAVQQLAHVQSGTAAGASTATGNTNGNDTQDRRHKTSDSIDTLTSSVHSISGGASSPRGAIDGSEKLLPLLKQISEWTLAIPLQVYPANRSIFESANLVRVLLRAPETGVRNS